MRSLVAIVVAVAQVAGPWLCCCGPVGASAAVPTAKIAAEDASEAACPHCVQHATGLESAAPGTNPTPADRHTPPGECPCCAVKQVDAVAMLPGVGADALLSAFGLLPPVLALIAPTADLPLAGAADSLPGVTDLPFLTAEARLHAHHALRC